MQYGVRDQQQERELISVKYSTTTMTNVRELTPVLAKQAEAELNEVPSRTEEDLKTLREWIVKQAHLTARLGEELTVLDHIVAMTHWDLCR